MEASGQTETVREGLFQVESAKHVLHVLGVEALVFRMFMTVADVFSFEDDAVHNRGEEGETAGHRNDHVFVGVDVHQGCFSEDVHVLADDRQVCLQGSIVLDFGVGVIDYIEQVRAVGLFRCGALLMRDRKKSMFSVGEKPNCNWFSERWVDMNPAR